MVGLSVVLESCNEKEDFTKKTPQVISKASMNMIKPPSSPASVLSPASSGFNPFSSRRNNNSSSSSFQAAGFLDHCFLCKQKLLPGRDIYMYKGDRAFCSEECRYRQIFMDEEESTTATVKAKKEHNCSLASTTSSSSSSSRCRSKGARNQANGFAC